MVNINLIIVATLLLGLCLIQLIGSIRAKRRRHRDTIITFGSIDKDGFATVITDSKETDVKMKIFSEETINKIKK